MYQPVVLAPIHRDLLDMGQSMSLKYMCCKTSPRWRLMGNGEQLLMESHLSILPHPSGLLIGTRWKECTSLIFQTGHSQDHLSWKHQSLTEHTGDLWKSYCRTMRPRCRPITWTDMHFSLWGRNLLLLCISSHWHVYTLLLSATTWFFLTVKYHCFAGWIMVNGQKTAGARTTNGMV